MKGNRLWLLGTVAVIAIVVILGWVVGISPKLAEGSAAISEQQTVDSQNLMQAATLEDLKTKFEDIDELKSRLETMRKFIPGTQPTDAFVDFLQLAADASVVKITKLSVAEPGLYGVAPLADGQVAPVPDENAAPIPGATAPEGVLTIAVTIEVTGTPANIIIFSRNVQLAGRLFIVPKFTLVPEDSKGTLSGFLYVIPDPNIPVAPEEEPSAEPTPEPTETPEPSPTPTATNG